MTEEKVAVDTTIYEYTRRVSLSGGWVFKRDFNGMLLIHPGEGSLRDRATVFYLEPKDALALADLIQTTEKLKQPVEVV